MTFRPGQQVAVSPDAFDRSPAWAGEIVGYWRNDAWIVREPDHGTTCAYSVQRLSRASKQLPTPTPYLINADEMAPQYTEDGYVADPTGFMVAI